MLPETQTHALEFVVEQTGAPSVDWVVRKLRLGLIPGRKAGRQWRMTDSDIAALVEYMAQPARPRAIDSSSIAETGSAKAGLTSRAGKRIRQSA